MSLEGLDVSHYNPPVDWAKAAAAGIAFVYVKNTDGAHGVDLAAMEHERDAAAAGLLVGSYHFLRPMQDVGAQVELFVAAWKTAPRTLPPMVDVEEDFTLEHDVKVDQWPKLEVDQRIAIVSQFVQGVQAGTGVTPVLYTRRGYWAPLFDDSGALAGCPLWLAEYRSPAADDDGPRLPAAWPRWTFWQYTGTGTVAGVRGPVDRDRFNGSLDDLRGLARSC